MEEIKKFEKLFESAVKKDSNFLSNIHSLSNLGSNPRGAIAELALVNFINMHIAGYKCEHVGVSVGRKKGHTEDIVVYKENSSIKFEYSVKTYEGNGCQISTDKDNYLFPTLESIYNNTNNDVIDDSKFLDNFISSDNNVFNENVMLISFDTKNNVAEISKFDAEKFINEVKYIKRKKARKHTHWIVYNKDDKVMADIHYGGKTANAFQRGIWTSNKNYFKSLSGGSVALVDNDMYNIIGKLLCSNVSIQNKLGDII